MNSSPPNAMIARLKYLSGAPNAVIAKGETEGKLRMLLSPCQNGLDSLFKEVRVFKVVLLSMVSAPNAEWLAFS